MLGHLAAEEAGIILHVVQVRRQAAICHNIPAAEVAVWDWPNAVPPERSQ